MKIQSRIFTASFFMIFILLFSFILFDNLGIAQKAGEKNKKKLYISAIKANGVPAATANRVKEGIRLAIFEGYGSRYQVIDDDAIKVMYRQAEAILSSGCDDTSCITQIADGINADEVVYGDVLQEGIKLGISITDLERRGVSLSTKSIVKISFFESQLDYAASETAKKLIEPKYKINMAKAPSSQEITFGGIEIKAVKGLDISVIRFKSEDETAGRIVEYSKGIVSEGDAYFEKQDYSKARDKYLEIINRVRTKLSEDKQAKVKEYADGVISRVDSTFVMEFKQEIENVDNVFKTRKDPDMKDLEKGLREYNSLENNISRIPDPYYKSRNQLINAVKDRKESIYLATAAGYEKSGDMFYREYKFAEAVDMYEKAWTDASNIKNDKFRNNIRNRITLKIRTARKTGQGYLANRVKSLVDQAEFYNFQDKSIEAKNLMEEAGRIITGPMQIFATQSAVETYNNYAKVLGIGLFDFKEKEMIEPAKQKKPVREVKAAEFKKEEPETKRIGGMIFVKINGGSFIMGSDDEEPRHRVTVGGFWIGVYEVTQRQYTDIMGNNPSHFQGDNLPVEQMSWKEAMEFCKRFGGKYNVKARLPYEAEWEYACRAGSKGNYYWGDEMNGTYCWWENNSGGKTHPVGEKKPNAWGLFDMTGNVCEWCMDWYGEDYYSNSPEDNPCGPSSGRDHVLRGGAWLGGSFSLLSGHRYRYDPQGRSIDYGFRVVIEQE